MRIPDEAECLALLAKYDTPDHIVAHSQKVWEVARVLSDGLLRRNYPINIDLLRASSLLHDIGKYPCIVDGSGYHDVRGEQILQSEGFDAVADIVVQHVVLRRSPIPRIGEEHVVFYADKRVVHDEVVMLDDRFEYLERTYGKTPAAIEYLMVMKRETLELEQRLFTILDFAPADVLELLT
jgi:uncharacterized protein